MLRAATKDPRVTQGAMEQYGPIPANLNGYYTESLIRPYIGETLYVVGHKSPSDIEELHAKDFGDKIADGTVQIFYRTVSGLRVDRIGAILQHQGVGYRISIPKALLDEGPVYVDEINKVICTAPHLDHAAHPLSEEHFTRYRNVLLEGYEAGHIHAPFRIVVNDWRARFASLYTVVNDRIACIPIKTVQPIDEELDIDLAHHYTADSRDEWLREYSRLEVIFNGRYADQSGNPTGHEIHRAYLDDLFDEHPTTWKIAGVWFSVDRRDLEKKLAAEAEGVEPTITLDQHHAELAQVERVAKDQLDMERHKSRRLQAYIDDAGALIKQLISGDYDPTSLQLALRRLDLEAEKLEFGRQQLAEESFKANAKAQEERYKMIANVAKTVGAVASVVVGGYALYSKLK